ncbi:MAG: WD40 repeat domain-containing protein [Rhodospirillales bacterium]
MSVSIRTLGFAAVLLAGCAQSSDPPDDDGFALLSKKLSMPCVEYRSVLVHDIQFAPSGKSFIVAMNAWVSTVDANDLTCTHGRRTTVSKFADIARDARSLVVGFIQKAYVTPPDSYEGPLYLNNEVKLPEYDLLDSALSDDGEWLLVVQAGGKSSIWNVLTEWNVTLENSFQIIPTNSWEYDFEGTTSISPDAQTFVIGTPWARKIGVWSREGKLLQVVNAPSGATQVGDFIDNEYFLGITDAQEVFVFSTYSGEVVNTFRLSVSSPVNSMALDRNTRTLFTGHTNGVIAAWNFDQKRSIARTKASNRAIDRLAVHVPSGLGIWWDRGNRFGELLISTTP